MPRLGLVRALPQQDCPVATYPASFRKYIKEFTETGDQKAISTDVTALWS